MNAFCFFASSLRPIVSDFLCCIVVEPQTTQQGDKT